MQNYPNRFMLVFARVCSFIEHKHTHIHTCTGRRQVMNAILRLDNHKYINPEVIAKRVAGDADAMKVVLCGCVMGVCIRITQHNDGTFHTFGRAFSSKDDAIRVFIRIAQLCIHSSEWAMDDFHETDLGMFARTVASAIRGFAL
jgi:hypothetical protein